MKMENRRIAVAMSGGVDSSVAAHRLVYAGEDVFGVMLRLWSAGPEEENRCCSPRDLANARAIAADLDIPFYVLDVKDRFKAQVVDVFLNGYAKGVTPNPCISCNRQIRWGYLLERVIAMGATHLATGHYAQIKEDEGKYQLHRPVDRSKDQSYVLHVLNQGQLARTLFPIGDLTKIEVRKFAQEHGLRVADRHDSQDLCFLGQMDYRTFLKQHQIALLESGPIVDTKGAQLGTHKGLAGYTIGQRKGLGLSAPEPYYVSSKNLAANTLVVGHRSELGCDQFRASDLNWISGEPPSIDSDMLVQVRYKTTPVQARISQYSPEGIDVQLSQPLADVTPGQWSVFYDGDNCLGGGMILP